MVLRRALVLGLLLVPAGVVAQVFPIPPLVAHVIVDSCSGCGSGGTLGQATMAASAPVVIASDQSSVHVTCDSGCGSPPATADGTAFVSGTTNVSPIAAVVDDVAPTTVPEDAYGAPRMTTNRVLYVDLKQTQANATAIKVDGSAVIQPVSGTVTANGPLTDTQLRASAVPVSGTVTVTDGAGALNVIVDSGTVTANAGSNLNTSALALSATQTDRTQKAQITDGTRDGTVKAASTLPLATDTAVVVTTRDTVTVSGTVTANQGGTWTVQPGNTANTTAWKVDGSAVTQPVSGTVAVSSITTSITPGGAAANLGKAEDAQHTSGDTGVMNLGVRKDTATQTTSADADYATPALDAYSAQFVRLDHPNRIRCTVAVSTATTLTAVGTSCAAPGAGLSLYITDIMFSASASGIAADAFPTLKYGTGGACGTGTTAFWGALTAAAIRTADNFHTPIKIPTNNEICWITSTAGSKFIVISGFIAP